MTTFTLDTDLNITAFAAAEQVPGGQDRFASEKEFAKLSADWPIARFPELWNAFAGAPVPSSLPLSETRQRCGGAGHGNHAGGPATRDRRTAAVFPKPGGTQ